MADCTDLVAAATALDSPRHGSSSGGQQPSRGPPYKYDIRVTGDLYADDRDNGASTKVSVKIVGNEDGDVFVKQDDSFDCESQNPPATDGETRNPQFTTKRTDNGGLELHIRALPLKPKGSAPATIAGGGGSTFIKGTSGSNSSASSRAASRITETPSRLRTIESYSRAADTRGATRMSEYARSRLSSAGQSFMEIRPAFEDASVMSDSECVRESRAHTRLTAELCASPALVGGGGSGHSFFESRPRSQSMTKMEDKSTMTTWRGIPDGFPTRNSSRASVSTSATTVNPDEDAGTGKTSPALSVLRGGGFYHGPENGVFSAFNGPPVAPPEPRAKGRDGTRGRSLPMDKYALPPRQSSKDKVNYRERVENLLTQYYPEHMLRKYLDELRRRYRFMGTSDMSTSDILKLLEDTTTDTQMKEQLRASVEELLKTSDVVSSSSDNEQTVASSPSQRHYLSIRETELRDVLDRTSVSPVPKGVRTTASDGLLVGGGMSMDQLSPVSQNFGTLYSDRMSVAASVVPGESVRSGRNPNSTTRSAGGNPAMADIDGAEKADSTAPEEPSRTNKRQKQPEGKEEQAQAGASSGAGGKGGAKKLDPQYWDDDEKYKMKPPNMRDAFTILKSQPIFVRDMPNSDIAFKSPFSRRYESPTRDQPSDDAAQSSGSRPGSSSRKGTNSFSERHPAESKVAKAVSELEEVLRRTEADALAGIENDFQEHQGCTSRCCASEHAANDTESVASHSSLVGGGASSRSASVATRISAMASKLDSMRPESANKLWASDSTIRTDVLLMAGKEFDDADQIDNDGNTEAGDDDEAAVPVARDAAAAAASANESSVSLPMRLEDMSAELAAVLRRTGGIDELRLRRTKSPVSTASYHSRQSTATRSERESRVQESRISSAKEAPEAASASATGSSAYRSAAAAAAAAARSSGTAATKHGSVNNHSLSELDIVMGRTGGAIDNRSALASRASVASPDSVLRGGSGTPGSPVVANDSENELASVMRRTTGYVPSVSSLASSAASDNGRPTTAASDLKSVRGAPAERPTLTAASARGGGAGTPSVANGHSSPQPTAPRTATPRTSAFSPRPPAASSIAAANRGSGGGGSGGGAAAPPTYASSPLRGPAYQPSERNAPSAGMPPPQHSNRSQRPAEAPASRYQSPSPELYRLPTPVFGRFPSPPAHIKNRAKENYEQENGGGAQPQQQQQQQQRPEDSRQEQPGSSRYRPHSHSVGQRETTPEPADQYREEPVVDRLDLETGSLASRRGRQRQGSEFGSSSTLTNGSTNMAYRIPKVVEEDVDSLASYPNLSRPLSPALVGGGGSSSGNSSKLASGASVPRAQSTLRGGGVLLPAFTDKDSYRATKKCESGCCGVCGRGVEKDDVVVRPQVMHASCLRCEACDCLLTSSTFRAVDGHVYCERDYKRYFESREEAATTAAPRAKVVAVRPGVSDKKFEEMNRAIMESFTSVDDFLQHMQQLREKSSQKDDQMMAKASVGDQAQVRRNGDVGVDRQTHYEREQATSPSGTPWITERVVDKKVKTKILEKRYPASAIDPASAPASVKSHFTAPASGGQKTSDTLVGGGGGSGSERPGSNASRPSTVLLNDTKSLNGWDHPLCPGCSTVVYLNDRVMHEGYGYHRTCMRCRQCSQVVPTAVAVRIKGAIYCKKHGNELLRRRSILMRKKSTMGRRSRHHRRRSGVSRERFADDETSAIPAVPPVPSMPMFSAQSDAAADLPPPSVPYAPEPPRRVNSALRSFLDAAAEQIDSGSFARTTARSVVGPGGHSTPMPQRSGIATSNGEEPRRPLPVPKPKTSSQPNYTVQPPSQQQQQQKQSPFYNRAASPPRSPVSSGQRSGSRSIFADSNYDSQVVNVLRQEAQRQINGSRASISGSSPQHHSRASSQDLSGRYLSPCGPSIAEVLNFGALGRQQQQQDGSNANMSSQFDPFADSQDQINGSSDFASPQRDRAGAAFSPNVHLDNLERRFRNANFRPPWALKSQTMFE